jgi:ATP-dependent Zn protease
MEGETFVWNALYSWAPIIVMVGFWIFLMRKFNVTRQAGYMERNAALMDRQVQILERIAVALEQRNTRA